MKCDYCDNDIIVDVRDNANKRICLKHYKRSDKMMNKLYYKIGSKCIYFGTYLLNKIGFKVDVVLRLM